MNFDDIKTTWKTQVEPELIKQNQQQLMEKIKLEEVRFNRTIYWRDFREVGAAILVSVFFLITRTNEVVNWPAYLAVFLILGVGVYLLWYTRQWKKKEEQFDNTLRGDLEKRSAQIAHQIQLLSWNVIWAYVLPITVAIWLFNWQDVLNQGSDIAGWRRIVIPGLLGLIVYGINRMAARSLKKVKRKVDLELEALLPSEDK